MISAAPPSPSLEDDLAALAAHRAQTGSALPNRWELYSRLRTTAPAFRFRNTVVVSRFADVAEVLRDGSRFRSGPPTDGLPARLSGAERARAHEVIASQLRWMTSLGGERHRALRTLATSIFTPRAIEEMRGRIGELAERMLDELSGAGTVDFVGGFAYRLPLDVICELLDIEVEHRERLHELWVGMAPSLGNEWRHQLPDRLDEVHASYARMSELLRSIFAARRAGNTSDLMGRLLEASGRPDSLMSEDDLVSIVTQLIAGGHQTTQDLLSNGLLELLVHHDQWELLCEDRALIPNAVEELLRYRSPSQAMERTAIEDTELHGVTVASGERIIALIGAANHDPDQFAHPERLDVTRANARSHVAFGRGPHFCLGAALSRLEAQIALDVLVTRFPQVALAGGDLRWSPHLQMLSIVELPVRLQPHAGRTEIDTNHGEESA